jgi:phage terminase large subunit-like protein
VRAKGASLLRAAEPVSALYEQSRGHHVGMFAALEDQLCSFESGSKNWPDRLDALVYSLADLMVKTAKG